MRWVFIFNKSIRLYLMLDMMNLNIIYHQKWRGYFAVVALEDPPALRKNIKGKTNDVFKR